MNETNIKHGYSLMVREARGAKSRAILNPGMEISKAGAEFMPPGPRGTILKSGAQYWGPQGLDFLTMLAPGAGAAKYLMHSGVGLIRIQYKFMKAFLIWW